MSVCVEGFTLIAITNEVVHRCAGRTVHDVFINLSPSTIYPQMLQFYIFLQLIYDMPRIRYVTYSWKTIVNAKRRHVLLDLPPKRESCRVATASAYKYDCGGVLPEHKKRNPIHDGRHANDTSLFSTRSPITATQLDKIVSAYNQNCAIQLSSGVYRPGSEVRLCSTFPRLCS